MPPATGNRAVEAAVIVFGAFSAWIWFAFLVLNALQSTPTGYVVGRLCVWDVGALVVIGAIAARWSWRTTTNRRRTALTATALSYIGLVAYLFFAGHPGA